MNTVITPAVTKVITDIRDLLDRSDKPHIPCPDVQPDPIAEPKPTKNAAI